MSRKMLITGGVGFIGVNSTLHFLEKGWDVTIFDNFSRKGVDMNADFIREKYGDRVLIDIADVCSDTDKLQKHMEQNDVCLHLAGQVAVTTSVTDPRKDFDTNAFGTFNVLEAIRKSERKPILLYTSTNKVYGSLPDVLIKEQADRVIFADGRKGITETEPLDFHSPYGCSKGAADQYVHDYARIFGLKTVVMRQSCIYGPHQFGIEDQGWVAWFLIAVMMGRKLHIYGNGKQVRDILHVADLVDLYDRIIEHIDVASGNVYNVGGGSENTLSLLEFLDLMDKKFDLHPEYDFADTRPGDQPIFVSDNSRAQSDLGWSPTYSVEDGLHNLIQWLRDNHSRLDKFYK